MSATDQPRPLRAPVPLWLLVLVGVLSAVIGVGLGQSGLLRDVEPSSVEGEARLYEPGGAVARFEDDDGLLLEFDPRGVAWSDGTTTYDALSVEPVGCLAADRPAPVELSYVDTTEGRVVVLVTCLTR